MTKYKVGDIVKAQVSGITTYGFFVRFDDNYTGLCHISEISSEFVSDVHEYVHEDEIIYVYILEIDEENKHMKISIKDIYYKTEDDNNRIIESRRGFLSLKNNLPTWISDKIKEYK